VELKSDKRLVILSGGKAIDEILEEARSFYRERRLISDENGKFTRRMF